jgi:F-type H+-transporting ATPase subunit delta
MAAKVSRRELARAVTAKLLAEPKRQKHWLEALAAYMVTHKMVDDADMIINDIARELHTQSGVLTVEVRSAKALSETLRSSIKQYLSNQTEAKRVNVHESVEPELLGGFIAQTPDAELDASVRTRLRKLASVA